MPSLGKKHAGGTAAAERKPKVPVIIRNVPSKHNWGWHSCEDQRMHLETLAEVPSFKVWLEDKGERAFEPASKVPVKLLKPLREFLAEHRQAVEDMWVRFMLDQGWLALHVAMPKVTLVAYPNMPTKFTRVIDLATWFTPEQLKTLGPEVIALNREMAALRLWTNRPEEQAYDARLSRLLWGKELTGR